MNAGWLGRLRSRPERRDVAVALLLLLVGTVLWLFGVHGLWQNLAVIRPAPWAFLVTLAAMVSLLLLRSRSPFLALGLGAIVATVDSLMGASLAVVFIFTDLIYAAIKYGSARGVRILLRIAAAAAIGLALAIALVAPGNPGLGIMLFQWGLIVLVSGLWGWNVRSERVVARAELAAQHAAENRELRTRIAHDLHDLVANQIAVAGLHIEAAKLQAAKLREGRAVQGRAVLGQGVLGQGVPGRAVPRDPEPLSTEPLESTTPDPKPPEGDFAPLTQSLDRAKNGTDRAHRELRGLISVLTVVDEVVGRAPVRLAEELPALGQLLPAGRTIQWDLGASERIRDALPPAQTTRARLVLRALQELVANTAKHGAGDVTLHADLLGGGGDAPGGSGGSDGLGGSIGSGSSDGSGSFDGSGGEGSGASGEVERDGTAGSPGTERSLRVVLENPVPHQPAPNPPGTGLGIRGTRVLLASLGGTLESSETPGGWRATLTLPLHTTDAGRAR